jgi:hypothetical protein
VLIQNELRGIGRFGYRVSKENFLFLLWTAQPCLTPVTGKYFVAQLVEDRERRAFEKARSFNRLAQMPAEVCIAQ